ncbi:MFS transporter [Sphingomonas solaris]|nr:MFS transporter [Sphingomonas solaris]
MTTAAAGEWRAHWPSALSAAVGMSFSTLYVYSAGGLTEPLEQEFGWSRAAIGSGISVLTITGSLLGPIMGAAVDRFGSRRIAVPGVIGFCLAFALLSLATESLWTWWLLWFLLALLGVGVKPAVWTTAVASLFQKSRGLALAVTLSGASLGSIFTPLLTNWLVDHHGWRGAFVGLPLIWGAIGVPLIFFGFRGASDKERRNLSRGVVTAPIPGGGLRVRDAILSRRFTSLLIAAMAFSLLAVSLIVSLIPILSSHGIPRGTGAGIAATIGITAVIGRIATGYLLDHFDPRLVSAVTMALPIVTLTLLLAMPGSVPLAFLAVLVMGLSLGAEVDAVAFLTGYYFGVRHYGLLFGTIMSGLSIAAGSAPLIAGTIFDRTGSYDLMLMGAIPLCLLAAGLIASLGLPPKAASRRE